MSKVVQPANETIIDAQGRPTAKFFYWLQLVSALEPIDGSGSPEGVVEARLPRFYIDTAAAPGSVLYVKQSDDILGDRTKGWVLIG